MTIHHVTDNTFADILQTTPTPIVLDVWAPWCGPCKMVTPALERIYAENETRFTLCLANMEDFAQIAKDLNIRATPTLIIFNKGTEIVRRSGAIMHSQISKWLDSHV